MTLQPRKRFLLMNEILLIGHSVKSVVGLLSLSVFPSRFSAPYLSIVNIYKLLFFAFLMPRTLYLEMYNFYFGFSSFFSKKERGKKRNVFALCLVYFSVDLAASLFNVYIHIHNKHTVFVSKDRMLFGFICTVSVFTMLQKNQNAFFLILILCTL